MSSENKKPANPDKPIHISVNVTTHGEGILAHKTLRSIYAGMLYASDRGLQLELNIATDNADEETYRAVHNFIADHPDVVASWHELQVGDVSVSRNRLVDCSQGKYLSFFDGDDFFTENYLFEAYTVAETHDVPAIYSPRYLIVFEGDHYLVEKLDASNSIDVTKNLFETNYYIGQSFIHRDIYQQLRYQPNTAGYGMEDWHFSCEAAALDYRFYNVPNTIFFYRRKKNGSLLSSHVQSSSIIHPTKLFTPAVYAALPSSSRSKMDVSHINKPTVKISAKVAIVNVLRRNELVFHYSKEQYKIHKSIVKTLRARHKIHKTAQPAVNVIETAIPQRLIDLGFTQELVHFWGRVNRFEPLIRASVDMLTYIPIVGYPTISELSNSYYEFCKTYQKADIADVVLVPHLIRGGADLAAIKLIQQLNEQTSKYTLVITTVDVDSPWLKQIKTLKNVICLESNVDLKHISEEARIQLIVRLIQNWSVKRLSIINSEVGYKLATKYGRTLSEKGCTIYLHTYAFNMTDDGYLFNWLANGLVDAYCGVDKFVTDSAAYRQQLVEINGFSNKKLATLYSPMDSLAVSKTNYTNHKRVLWASRVCDDKLIETLVEVGKLLSAKGIKLDIYGSIDEAFTVDDRFIKMIKPHSNITYKGAYESFASLPFDNYDMLLLTTKNEGMPFIILEACQANIYIVTANVGGIPECIKEGVNGSMIKDKFDPIAYTKAIIAAYESRSYADKKIISTHNKQFLRRHSVDAYSQAVRELLNL